MSNARVISWVASAIALSVIAHLILDIRGSGISRIARRGTIAPGADAASAISVKCNGKPAALLSKASGDWRIVAPFRASADRQAVLEFLDALAFSPILDSMDDMELRKLDRNRQDFGLQPPVLEVETLGVKGAEKVSFGGFTPAEDGVYATVEGESVVFVVPTNVFAAVNRNLDGFRSRTLFNIAVDEVGAFDIRRTAGAFSRFIRDGEKWRMSEPAKSAASSSRVRKFMSKMLDARANSFIWPVGATNETETASASLLAGYGLDPDSAVTLTFKGIDGLDRQVSFGNETEEGLVYALVHNGGAIVTVDSSLKDALLSGVDDLIDTRLFPVEKASVASISISDSKSQFILAKGLDGAWRIDAPVSAPADASAVNDLIDRLMALNVSDADVSGVRVTLSSDAASAFVPREFVFADTGLNRFRSKEMLNVQPSQVRRLVVTKEGAKSVAVVYDSGRRVWNVESFEAGGVADEDVLNTLLSEINPLTAVEVVQLRASTSELTRYGLESPVCTIAIDRAQADSVRKNIRIGDKSGDGRYATIGSSDAVFLLSDKTVKNLMAPIVR